MTYGFADDSAVTTETGCQDCDCRDEENQCCTEDDDYEEAIDDEVDDEETGFEDDEEVEEDETGFDNEVEEDLGFAAEDYETEFDSLEDMPEYLIILEKNTDRYLGCFLSDDWDNAMQLMAEFVTTCKVEEFVIIRPIVDTIELYEVVDTVILEKSLVRFSRPTESFTICNKTENNENLEEDEDDEEDEEDDFGMSYEFD